MSKEQKPVHVTKSSELTTSGGQTDGMIRQGAISGLSPNICANRMLAQPHSASAVHHHGEQDTIVYVHFLLLMPFVEADVDQAVSGHGTIVSDGGKKRQTLAPGDYALIPAYAEHQEANDGDEEVVWCIVRSGGTPVVVNLEGWGMS